MTNENIFEIAVRSKLRFPFRGMVSTEDLWDLTVKDLDSIFKTLNAQVKTENEESLLATKSNEDTELITKIEIIKYIVNIKLNEANERMLEADKKAKRQQIMEILSSKQTENLQNKSPEELQAMLENM